MSERLRVEVDLSALDALVEEAARAKAAFNFVRGLIYHSDGQPREGMEDLALALDRFLDREASDV